MKKDFIVRRYRSDDIKEIANLFYNTVHSINAKDYTKLQLDVWANKEINLEIWNASFLKYFTLVVTKLSGEIIGFGDIDIITGYLDKLYVHKDFQGLGIATLICDELEKIGAKIIETHASITAKTFFEKRGYIVIKEQEIEREGIILKNYLMKKYK